jgi:hypothetical protein
MTTTAALPRAACTVHKRDWVTLPDGRQRVVEKTATDTSSPGSPRVVLRFTDGSTCRVHPGVLLAVERPA